MSDDEIVALAKVTREYVAEAIRISPELAAQVASAARLLHELPAIEERTMPRLVRVERDEQGNFIPIYGDPQE